jgi:hypothetical protein
VIIARAAWTVTRIRDLPDGCRVVAVSCPCAHVTPQASPTSLLAETIDIARQEHQQQALVRSLVRQLEDLHFVAVRQLAGTDAATVRKLMGPQVESDA